MQAKPTAAAEAKANKSFANCKFAVDRFVELAAPDQTVLDIGCSLGRFTEHFRKHGLIVTPLDHLDFGLPQQLVQKYPMPGDQQWGAIWASNVLEHALNVNDFLQHIRNDLYDGGLLGILVPALKHSIVGGHVTLWNAGLLIYNLVMAGFDCSQIRVKQQGPRIAAMLYKRSAELPDNLHHDAGDIEKLAEFFPPSCRKQGFNGNISTLNW